VTEPSDILRLERVTKRFPGVLALDAASVTFRAGEVHVLLGENGAGKSTLISILSGAAQATSGRVILNGEECRFASVAEASRAGISAVYQEFSLVSELTVTENIFLGRERRGRFGLDRAGMRQAAARILEDLDFRLDPEARVATLSRAQQQMVEIAKGYRDDQKVVIFDEPTASLSTSESEKLFHLIDRLRARGIAIVYITHRMAELHRLADRVTVMRDGKIVGTLDHAETSEDELIRMMAGRDVQALFPDIPPPSDPAEAPVLSVDGLGGRGFSDITFRVGAGEIVGLAGLVGCGKSDVGRCIAGLERVRHGRISLNGRDVAGLSIRKRMREGVYYLPSDRKAEGLILTQGARFNISIRSGNGAGAGSYGVVSRREEARKAQEVAERVDLRPLDIERNMILFSGGNQQKVLFAKAIAGNLKLLILDEPTVGVDVNARAAIYRLVADLAARGVAVLMISSDLTEILNLCSRVHVMCEGRVAGPLAGEEINENKVLERMFA
jgi:ribose transport system ATP-binding protein